MNFDEIFGQPRRKQKRMGARVVAATLEELEKGKRRERKREREGGQRERKTFGPYNFN